MRVQSSGGLAYLPALDGLRGVAVLGVLLFHAEFSWASGGFLGVSTFFTLSGYLITTLLLRERERTDRTDLRAFWSRRFRRLMPAALLALAGAVVFGALVATPGQLVDLRGDVMAALVYVANWRFIFDANSYADLFAAPSPVLQFWSLAIEEQFYLLFPLVMAGTFALSRARRSRVGEILALGFVVSVGATVLLTITDASPDRIYYGTDTRMAELLAGALLAVALESPRPGRAITRWAPVVGPTALVILLVSWSIADLDSSWIYDGGLPVYGVLSALVVAAAISPVGAVRAGLAIRPLVLLGLISYGVYLYHWPIYLWLTPERTNLDQVPLFGLRLLVTLAVAVLSFRFVEQPIRRGRRLRSPRQVLIAAPAAVALIIIGLGATTAVVPVSTSAIDFDQALDEAAEVGGEAVPTRTDRQCPDGSPLPPSPDVAPYFAVVGDSTALLTSVGLATWANCSRTATAVGGSHALGCGVVGTGQRRILGRQVEIGGSWRGNGASRQGSCAEWQAEFDEVFGEVQPDVILVGFGPWDLADQIIDGDDTWTHIGEAEFDAYLMDELRGFADQLTSLAPQVAWLLGPPMVPPAEGNGDPFPEYEPERLEAYNTMISSLAVEYPSLSVIDLRPWYESRPGGLYDPDVRPDGVHLSSDAALQLAVDYLGPQLLEVYDPTT